MGLMHSCFENGFENDLSNNANSANDEFKHDSDAELADKITQLAGHINAVTYRFLKALAEFDRRKGWNKNGISSCSHWLNWKCSISETTAREKLRVAHCLDRLPKTNAAFENGVLSYSKVRAMTRVATDDNEDILLEVAMGEPVREANTWSLLVPAKWSHGWRQDPPNGCLPSPNLLKTPCTVNSR